MGKVEVGWLVAAGLMAVVAMPATVEVGQTAALSGAKTGTEVLAGGHMLVSWPSFI